MVKRLLVLNGLAALMVVVYHAASYGFNAMFLWTNRYQPVAVPNYDQLGSLSYYILILVRQIAEFAIPGFLFVSGFFIAFAARASRAGINSDFIASRVKKLVIPFVIWTVVAIVLLRRFPPTVEQILSMYYYIPLIIQFYLLSPLIVPLARKHWQVLLIVAAVLQLGIQGLRHLQVLGISLPGLDLMIRLTPMWFFPGHLFFFSIGVVAGVHLKAFSVWINRYRWVLLSATVILLVLSVVEYQEMAYLAGEKWVGPAFSGLSRTLFAMAFVLAFLAFDKVRLPLSDKISYLGEKSLGIYFVNIPAIYLIAVLLYRGLPWMLGKQILYQPVLILFGLSVPLVLMAFFSKSPGRRVYRYLFG